MTDTNNTSPADEYLDYLQYKTANDREIAKLQAEHRDITRQMDQLTLKSEIGKEVRALGGTDDIADLIAPIVMSKASKKRDGSWSVGGQSLGQVIDDLRSSDALRAWLKPATKPSHTNTPEGYIRR